jgi:ribosomal-protein-alanine N-acetyltransferase
MTLPTIQTERLVLRPLDDGDVELLHEAYTDDETMAWWHQPVSGSLDESAQRVADLRGCDATFAVCVGSADTPAVGHAGWLTAPRDGRGGFGYLVRREQWGTGIAAEAATAALQHGFDVLGPASAELWVYDGNVRSARLAERIGATLRGRFVAFNFVRGRMFDTLVYGIDRPGATQPPRIVIGIPSFEVVDVAAAIEFWRERLGFEVEFTVGDPPTMASMARGDWRPQQVIVRFRAAASGDVPVHRAMVLDVLAPDVDDLQDELRLRGAAIEAPLATMPWGMRELTVVDPNGIRVRFYAPAV